MNTFNRIVVILMFLLLFVIVTIGLVALPESLRVLKSAVDSTLDTVNRVRPGGVYLTFRVLLILCALFIDALLIGLLLWEVRGPARRHIRVKRVGGGEVMVTAESIAERLQFHLDQLADVINVKVKVSPRAGGVDVEVFVQTGVDVNVPDKAEQVLEVTRQVVEDKMGLVLARKPRVSIHAMPTPGLAVRPRPSEAAATLNKPGL